MPTSPLTQEILLSQGYAINAATQVRYRPVTPVRVHRVSYVASTTQTGASAILTLALLQSDNTAAAPSGAALDTMTITTALGTVNLVTYYDFQASYGDLIIYPGEQLSILSDGGGAAGVGDLWLTVEPLGFNAPDVRQHAIAGAHPGSTDLPTAFTNVTEVTS